MSALPKETLELESSIDAVCQNEGVYTIKELVKVEKFNQEAMKKIPGLCFRNDQGEIEVNPPSKLVAKANLEPSTYQKSVGFVTSVEKI